MSDANKVLVDRDDLLLVARMAGHAPFNVACEDARDRVRLAALEPAAPPPALTTSLPGPACSVCSVVRGSGDCDPDCPHHPVYDALTPPTGAAARMCQCGAGPLNPGHYTDGAVDYEETPEEEAERETTPAARAT